MHSPLKPKPLVWEVPKAPSTTVLTREQSVRPTTAFTDEVVLDVNPYTNVGVLSHPQATYLMGHSIKYTPLHEDRLAGEQSADGLKLFVLRHYHHGWHRLCGAATEQHHLAMMPHTRASQFLLIDSRTKTPLAAYPAVRHTLDELQRAPSFQTPSARQALATHLLPLVGAVQSMGAYPVYSHGNIVPRNIVFDGRLQPLLDNFEHCAYERRSRSNDISYAYLAPEALMRHLGVESAFAWSAKSPGARTQSSYEIPGFVSQKAADLFSMGLVLLETTLGVQPFDAKSVGLRIKDARQAIEFTRALHRVFIREYPQLQAWLRGGDFPAGQTRLLQRNKDDRTARAFFIRLSGADRFARSLHVALDLMHPNPLQRGRMFEETLFGEDANAKFLVEVLAQHAESKTLSELERCAALGPLSGQVQSN